MTLKKIRETFARRHNVRAHFWQSCANYVQQGSGLALGVILARLLSPDNFGEFAYVTAVVGLILLPAGWSLAPQIVSEGRSNPHITSDALWVSRKITLVRGLLALAACLYLLLTRGWNSCILALVIAPSLVASEFIAVMRASLEGRGQFKVNFYDSIWTFLITAALAIPAAWMGAGIWALALPAIPMFLGQWLLFSRFAKLGFSPPAPRSAQTYFRSGTELWLAGIGEGALQRADKYFLGKFSTMSSLGDYNRAFNYSPLSARILNSLLTNPTVAALVHANHKNDTGKILFRCSYLLAVGGAANLLLWWFFSDPMVPFVFGEQWRAAIPVFQAMAPMSLAISFAYLPAAVSLAKKRYRPLAIIRVGTLAVFVAVALTLGHKLDAVRMAWLFQATLVTQGFLLILVNCKRSPQ